MTPDNDMRLLRKLGHPKLGLGLGLGLSSGVGRWSPANLGASLLGWWDAERPDKLTLSGSNVTTWTDLVGGYALTQALSASKPTYSPTAFNGRPGVTFDGTDDYLDLTGVPFPVGAAPCEIWAVVSQDALPADATARDIFGYGGGVNARRTLRRTVNTGANTFTALSGTGAGALLAEVLAPAFTGICLLRLLQTATDVAGSMGGGAAVTAAGVPATGSTRVRMGARSDTLANYFNGKINSVFVTSPLSAYEVLMLEAFANTRKAA